jgi:hypothetical protein
LQGTADMLLASQLGKGLGTVFTGKDNIGHGRLPDS